MRTGRSPARPLGWGTDECTENRPPVPTLDRRAGVSSTPIPGPPGSPPDRPRVDPVRERTVIEHKRTTCNRDCPDACAIIATVEDGRITQLQGDKEHPVTRGFLCYRTSHFLPT